MAFVDPAMTQTTEGLYLSWSLGPPGQTPPRTVLARIIAATGHVYVKRAFPPGYLNPPIGAAGSLWATFTTTRSEWLLRLNPATLVTTGQLRVATPNDVIGGAGEHMAFAGGAVWLTGGDRLIRVSPASMTVTTVVRFPGANSAAVSASADGHVLVVSEARDGAGTIQRRHPVTGALLASHPMVGVTAAQPGGVTGSGAWISEATGMMGYVERFTLAALTPEQATAVEGTNGIGVRLADGALWITSPVGGARLNYCADPVTGHRRAPIPLPDLNQDFLLAVGPADLYYAVPAANRTHVERTAIPAACLNP
jgi:hypothetical protein